MIAGKMTPDQTAPGVAYEAAVKKTPKSGPDRNGDQVRCLIGQGVCLRWYLVVFSGRCYDTALRGHTPLNIFRILLVAFCVHLTTSSMALQSPDEIPEHWREVGTVREWMDLDAVFYRSPERRTWRTENKDIPDQPGPIPPDLPLRGRPARNRPGRLGLELSVADQARRIELAAEELKIVTRFLNRMRGWARDFQSNGTSSWGRENAVDVLPQCLAEPQHCRSAGSIQSSDLASAGILFHLYRRYEAGPRGLCRCGKRAGAPARRILWSMSAAAWPWTRSG